MASIVCVLKTGGDFKIEHVQALASELPGLICLSDTLIPDVVTIPLRHNWPGWWSKMELFRPDIKGDLFYLDLDTLVFGDIQPIIDAANGLTTMLSDFYWPEKPASGLMYIAEEDKQRVWAEWMKNPALHMNQRPGRGVIGDQGFLGKVLKPRRWQAIAPGSIVSYKAHCKGGKRPKGAQIVCFHGKPRPWELTPQQLEALKCS